MPQPGEYAQVYEIPPRTRRQTPVEKRIPESVFKSAATELRSRGCLTRQWFCDTFPDLAAHDPCTFTTLGGVFELLGEVEYARAGVYRAVGRST